jgi:hypothetical protein
MPCRSSASVATLRKTRSSSASSSHVMTPADRRESLERPMYSAVEPPVINRAEAIECADVLLGRLTTL